MAALMVHEVLEKAAAAKTRKEKSEVLKLHESQELRDILQMNFDDGVTIILPSGAPPFKENENGKGIGNRTTKFGYFCKNGPKMRVDKREKMFIDMLEEIHPKEAHMLIEAKDGKLKYKGLTKKLVNDTFPNLLIK